MKRIVIVIFLLLVITSNAYAWLPILPSAKPDNFSRIERNFRNIVYKKATINTGDTSVVVTSIPCDSDSYIVATNNTNSTNYVARVQLGINTCEVFLDGAASATVSVSIIAIIK